MAVIPIILINGTTADADEVMSDFDEIYDNITQINVQSANKTGTGKFVLDTAPTISGATLTTATITTGSGGITMNSGGDLKIYSDVATTLKFQVDGATGDFGIPATRKFYLDGTALTGDTYIYESSANNVIFFVGGASILELDGNSATFGSAVDVVIAATKRLYLDGQGDTYIFEDSGNSVRFVVGGVVAIEIDNGAGILLEDVDPPSANYINRNSGVKAWAQCSSAGGLTGAGNYNVSGNTRNAQGDYTVSWNTNFNGGLYVVCATVQTSGRYAYIPTATQGGASCNVLIKDFAGAAQDADFQVIAIGDQ